jgi:hypothetical protein
MPGCYRRQKPYTKMQQGYGTKSVMEEYKEKKRKENERKETKRQFIKERERNG